VTVDSSDEMGAVAQAFNDLVAALERFRFVQEAVAGMSAALGRHLKVEDLAASCLRRLGEYTQADGGVLLADDGDGRLSGIGSVGDDDDRPSSADVAAARGRRRITRHARAAGEVLTVPIERNDLLVGAAVLTRRSPFDRDAERLLATIRPGLGIALQNADTHARMRRLACEDALTGLCNRRHALERLEQAYGAAVRSRGSVGVVLFDVDRFKQVNDRHGHAGGDAVLRTVADAARDCLRDDDLVARYGGEEFLVILPDATPRLVEAVGERIRRRIAASATLLPGGTLSVTVSLGAAVLPAPGLHDLDDLLRAADDALYRAKASGRDRLVCA
jgi:diguanylate cyclase (GGDEF)-like protein